MNREARKLITAMVKDLGLSELEQRLVLEKATEAAKTATGLLDFTDQARRQQWDSRLSVQQRRIASALARAGDVLIMAEADELPSPADRRESEADAIETAIASLEEQSEALDEKIATDGFLRQQERGTLDRQLEALRGTAKQLRAEHAKAEAEEQAED